MQAHAPLAGTTLRKGELKGWHALMWFLGFFGFMFAVNGIFLWTAITTFPGEDVEKSYLTGLDYNHELDRRARQAEAGWTAEIGVSGEGSGRMLQVRLAAEDGRALAAAAAQADLRHPANRNLDRTLVLSPQGDGFYAAAVPDVAAGRWTVELEADLDSSVDGMEFKAARRLDLP